MRETTFNEVHPKERWSYGQLEPDASMLNFMTADEKLNNDLFTRRGTAF